jgi:hypothetical protein
VTELAEALLAFWNGTATRLPPPTRSFGPVGQDLDLARPEARRLSDAFLLRGSRADADTTVAIRPSPGAIAASSSPAASTTSSWRA